MVIDMNDSRLRTVAQLRAFLEGTPEGVFQPLRNDTERYGFITAVLKRLLLAPRTIGQGRGAALSQPLRALN